LLSSGREVSALELSAISLQYCARISSLRKAGCVISNRVEVQQNGGRHGFYKLVYRPPMLERADQQVPQHNPPNSAPGSLFPENAPCKVEAFQYPD
jgi:hypothetical protein